MARVLMILIMLASGTATSQLPEFAQQYRQRLGGAIDALEQVLREFKTDASRYGLSVQEAVDRQKKSDDPFIRDRGVSMEMADHRLANLKQQQTDLENATAFERIAIFLRGFDRDLAHATAEDYVPAVPVSVVGFVTAGVGALAGLLGIRLIVSVLRIGRRRKRLVQ